MLTRCHIARAGVKRHNRNNAALKEGLEALGAHCAEVPRNCAASGHDCGHCGFGCASGGKQDASGTWLLDAVTAGARILTGRAPQGRKRMWGVKAVGLRRWHSPCAHMPWHGVAVPG